MKDTFKYAETTAVSPCFSSASNLIQARWVCLIKTLEMKRKQLAKIQQRPQNIHRLPQISGMLVGCNNDTAIMAPSTTTSSVKLLMSRENKNICHIFLAHFDRPGSWNMLIVKFYQNEIIPQKPTLSEIIDTLT